MQISKNTSNGVSKIFLIKMTIFLIIIISSVIMLDKVEFPSPKEEIKKTIPNEKFKIVK
jgi:hypothetical protein|tara:strand:+ start:42 stop:218 length:177 start_codon:yes stop_codon:yes gene_type:complete